MNNTVFAMRMDAPKFVYIINESDVKAVGMHVRKDHPKAKICLVKTLASFMDSDSPSS